MDLSIIMPVYNVEKYIKTCLESIFKQGLDVSDFEVIIVNDGTKDRSMEVIANIIDQHNNITVINQENQGLSVARNNGIAVAKGKYILMLDSDDLLIRNSILILLKKALETEADLIVADYITMNDEEILNYHSTVQEKFKMDIKTGEKLYLEDLKPNQYYVWRTLYRRDFLLANNLKFIPGIYFQDVPFTHEAYLKAKKCIRTPWLLNIYRRGHDSAASALNSFNIKKGYDFCIAISESWKLTHQENLSPKLRQKLIENIYSSFTNLVYRIITKIDSQNEGEEILTFLHSKAPDMGFTNSTMQSIGTYLFSNTPRLYLLLVKIRWKIRK